MAHIPYILALETPSFRETIQINQTRGRKLDVVATLIEDPTRAYLFDNPLLYMAINLEPKIK